MGNWQQSHKASLDQRNNDNIFCVNASDRRSEIVAAARCLYEEKGLTKTTVKDISERVGVTRSLFYHYFENKEAVTTAVLDDYVNDFIELVTHWNENRERGNIQKALEDCIRVLRLGLFDKDAFRRSLIKTENAALYLQFTTRTAEVLADYIVKTTVVDYGQYHHIEITYVREMFTMLIIGLIGFMRSNPDEPDEVLKTMIAQTLHLDLDGSKKIQGKRSKQGSTTEGKEV